MIKAQSLNIDRIWSLKPTPLIVTSNCVCHDISKPNANLLHSSFPFRQTPMALFQQSPCNRVLCAFTLLVAVVAGAATAPTAEEKMNLVAGGFSAFAKGDFAAFVAIFAEDHVYTVEGGPELPWTGTWKVSPLVLNVKILEFSLLLKSCTFF